ncbi:hypothetical protein FC52_GL001486 [Lactobacillus pasteurii DSM 23907 = CRBIP 24.76]|uniref:Rpn family recombination-promoting nuclease/putative transposase n=1 Tax=Lactobacillus pasteurii TaxID=872327 RepID=UPI0006EEB0FF|nr:Rpn family recombination-promoting nuclease/putative transposase [Lactobacillus pasteurii]KRK07791.1 hypothetical protein FC52_GL001486 [Lactobacillus pasteurii DSM 23907 = CRBIP 24.76]TDG77485.1 hypothetical protein C5L33_000928 [Lactobacillus pasteurii]
MAEKDKVEKLFFSHRDIFADVFNCCVFNDRQAVDSLMPVRVLNYNISSYAKQFSSGADKLYPVMTIVLYFGQKRWKASRQLEDLFDL